MSRTALPRRHLPPPRTTRPSISHPSGGGGKKKKKSATTKSGKRVTKTAKGKTEDTAKGKEDVDGSHRCANCDKPGATKRCGRCGVEWYCDRNCQRVRGWWW